MERRFLLDRGSVSLGVGWARSLCETMRAEGRTVAGGWPGTVVEARARIAHHLGQELTRESMLPLTQSELSAATKTMYAQAKKSWGHAARLSEIEARRLARAED